MTRVSLKGNAGFIYSYKNVESCAEQRQHADEEFFMFQRL